MPNISIENLNIKFGAVTVLDGLNLAIADREFMVLLGPSGCGKSTLLNTVAGLIDANDGRILIDGTDVITLEPKDRGLAMVFQSYALYPQMSVRGNLGFGLKVAGLPKAEIEKRVSDAADLLQIRPLLDRKPGALSGGQRQRVAIGRALVRQTKIFLFDEPLSNLDAQLRAELRLEIKRLHQRLKTTVIYVTHDQIEALTLADRIAVMKDRIIQQLGTPEEIYERPANRFVASFVGSPAMTFLPATLVSSDGRISAKIGEVDVPLENYPFKAPPQDGMQVELGIRPEQSSLGEGPYLAKVEMVEPMGADTLVWSKLGDCSLSTRVGADTKIIPGETVPLGFVTDKISLFSKDTGLRL